MTGAVMTRKAVTVVGTRKVVFLGVADMTMKGVIQEIVVAASTRRVALQGVDPEGLQGVNPKASQEVDPEAIPGNIGKVNPTTLRRVAFLVAEESKEAFRRARVIATCLMLMSFNIDCRVTSLAYQF